MHCGTAPQLVHACTLPQPDMPGPALQVKEQLQRVKLDLAHVTEHRTREFNKRLWAEKEAADALEQCARVLARHQHQRAQAAFVAGPCPCCGMRQNSARWPGGAQVRAAAGTQPCVARQA